MEAPHLVNISDLSDADLQEVFDAARDLKSRLKRGQKCPSLEGKTLAMIFEKPSLRTRLTFEVSMYQLGGMGHQHSSWPHRASSHRSAMASSERAPSVFSRKPR